MDANSITPGYDSAGSHQNIDSLMIMDIDRAIQRLNLQLPLLQRQRNLSPALKSVHQDLIRTMVRHGYSLSNTALAKRLGNEQVGSALQRLAADDLIVLDPETQRPVGVYPVTLESTPHQLKVFGNTIHAMCALDALSVAPMFETSVEIQSRCHVSDIPIVIRMHDDDINLTLPSSDIMVGIHWQMPSDCAAHSMCTDMVFLVDAQAAQEWQIKDKKNKSVFTLQDSIDIGIRYFLPLIDS